MAEDGPHVAMQHVATFQCRLSLSVIAGVNVLRLRPSQGNEAVMSDTHQQSLKKGVVL